jgi:hypothetical protein
MRHHSSTPSLRQLPRSRQLSAICSLLSVLLIAQALGLVAASPVRAASGDCVTSGSTVTCTYTFTGAEQTFTVPAGIRSVIVVARGAPGGEKYGVRGGRGALVTADLPVTPGQTLYVTVGGAGADDGLGGYNGGGSSDYGSGGGGASDVRTESGNLANRLLVAAGGGGSGEAGICSFYPGGGAGGDAGRPGGNGEACEDGTPGGTGGGAGTQTTGGAGGNQNGEAGSLGQGGHGGSSYGDPQFRTGGGAGGGLYGGGGGGGALDQPVPLRGVSGHGGGGGGSSLVPSSGGSVGLSVDPASVTISYSSVLYNFSGFSSPVDAAPVVNSAKAGQTIPLKWRFTDAQGVPVTNLTTVQVTVTSLNCASGTATDAIEQYAVAESGLQNLGNGYYQFNWKSPKSYAGWCKTLNLDLGQGSTALFQFK